MKKLHSACCGIIAATILAGWGSQESNIAGDKKHDTNFYGILQTWSNPDTKMAVENISIDNLIKQIPVFVKPSTTKKSTQNATKKAAKDAAMAAKKAAAAANKAAKAALKASKTPKDLTKTSQDASLAAQAAAEAAAAAAKAATAAAQIAEQPMEQKATDPKTHVLQSDPVKTFIKANIDLVEVGEIRIPNPNEIWTYKKEKSYRESKYLEIIFVSKDAKKTQNHYLIENRKKIYCDRVSSAGPEEQEVPLEALKSLKVTGYTDRKADDAKRKQEEEKRIIKKLATKKTK
ncbi:hypothetical protein KAH94_00135 [bacterium]|nr:hypothetical protein [bacterium]